MSLAFNMPLNINFVKYVTLIKKIFTGASAKVFKMDSLLSHMLSHIIFYLSAMLLFPRYFKQAGLVLAILPILSNLLAELIIAFIDPNEDTDIPLVTLKIAFDTENLFFDKLDAIPINKLIVNWFKSEFTEIYMCNQTTK